MAYVRTKGNQLAVVHGVRNPETRSVEQKTLFTLYSKAEALAAVGDRSWQFRRILEDDNPGIRFDWKKIEAGVRDNLDHLPDLYKYKKERVEDGFRAAVCGLARELILADPQMLVASARLLQTNRHELTYLRDLIDWRLEVCDQDESEWNQDNPFYWRTASHRREVPGEQWEQLSDLFAERRYEECEALARLLTDCWPNFARGFNYLGLIDMEREDYESAIEQFDEAIKVGRTLFPKRLRKDMWWSDHDTRPYIRAITYKAHALNRKGDYVGALDLCQRLETECCQDIASATERIPIYLNSEHWEDARRSARYVCGIYPWEGFPLAFAHFQLGNREEALVYFLHAAIQYPRTARMLMGFADDEPTSMEEARDHNAGVAMIRDLDAYLASATEAHDRFFHDILEAPPVKAVLDDYQEARKKWLEERGRGDRKWFEKMNEMKTEDFARSEAAVASAEMGW